MSSETFSLIVRCWRDLPNGTTHLKIMQVGTAEEIYLNEGSFLLRISLDEAMAVERCVIRHIASGREAHVQSGPGIREFITSCLLTSNEKLEPLDLNTTTE